MGPSRDEDRLEWIAGPTKAATVGDATLFRSTWLTASQATLRDRGLGERYTKALAGPHRDAVLALVPGVWVPMDVARTHYAACDSLDLPVEELLAIGAIATQRANTSWLSFVKRMAQGVGVTPWAVLPQVHRIRENTVSGGGAVRVARLGPKEARADILGYPLAELRYNRITMRGIFTGVLQLFCETIYVKEVSSMCDARSIVMRLSWV